MSSLPAPASPGRNLPEPSPEALAHSRRLAEAIRAHIITAGGWISFAEYMELALYAPGLGYYTAGATKLGWAGDFVTAPEMTPLFGHALATPVAALLAEVSDDHGGGDCLELGAGSGRLAASLLGELAARGRLPTRYYILDVSADLRSRQREYLYAEVPEWADRVVWLDRLPDTFTGCILANEVLDAMPVHRVRWGGPGGPLFEQGVSATGEGFVWAERPLAGGPLHDLARRLPGVAGQASEVSLAIPAWLASVAAVLARGALLCIDYGFPRPEFYHPQRSDGTLMCHYRHRAHGDPFWLPGLNDITAHVDFSAVAESGRQAGLDLLGYTPQAAFLLECGLLDRLAGLQPGSAIYLREVAAVQKLIQPHEMGELFKVIALGRGLGELLPGFGKGDRRHAL